MKLFGLDLHMHNLYSCQGFGGSDGGVQLGSVGGLNFGDCMQAKLFAVVLFFIIAVIRKWGGEEAGLDFNFWFALAGGMISYILIVTLFGSVKIGFVIGLLIAAGLGYGGGFLIGGSDNEYGE